MAIHFHESDVPAERLGGGLGRQRLIDEVRIPGARALLDRIAIDAGATLPLNVEADSLVWFQLLEGVAKLASPARLNGGGTEETVADRHSAFLPQGFRGTLTSDSGAVLILATVPNASKYDQALAEGVPPAKIIDWTREPVLASEHDARSRIYLASPGLFGTHAVKGEIIIYPPGTSGANHHHVGADHFMVFLKGRGTAWANEEPFPVKAGDVVYYPDLERHYLKADDDGEMAFVEFFVPGRFKTVWVNPALACTWNPTGRSYSGGEPVREISRHGGSTPTVDV
jgi:quercetin dioxygenase-like cupin family protein